MPFGILFLELTYIQPLPSFFVFLIFISFHSVYPPVALTPPSFLYDHAFSRHHHTHRYRFRYNRVKSYFYHKDLPPFPPTEDRRLDVVLLVLEN